MSVAFRRESDEEHKEPRFELPIPPGPNLVTSRGLSLIEAKVVELEAAVAVADDTGREALRRELRYWHTRRATAEIAPPPRDDEVAIGTRVTLRMAAGERVVEIVGADEAEPAAGRLSFQAPLARAVVGAAAGERVAFNGVPDAIEVLAIEAIEG